MDTGNSQSAGRFVDLFDVNFHGEYVETLVTPEGSKVVDWINQIERMRYLDRRIVGLDVEWRPSFSRQQNPAAILQLCVGRRCLIFQLLYCDRIPAKLHSFLGNDDYIFVGVGIRGDVEKLSRDHSLNVANAEDLCAAAARAVCDYSLRNVGMKRLASLFLRLEIEKPRRVTMSRWDQAWLTDQQIKYACHDAHVSYKLGKILNVGCHTVM